MSCGANSGRDRLDGAPLPVQEAKGERGRLLQVASLNRELPVLRRMFHLAQKWGKVERAFPNVKMLPGEKHRERVLTAAEEDLYLRGASTDAMAQYADEALLRGVATILLDCGLRPEECFRLRTENVDDGNLEIHYGKRTMRVAGFHEASCSGHPRYAPVENKWWRLGPCPNEERAHLNRHP
jgi:integrase